MRSSGERRLNQPKKVLCCHVKFLDDAVATYEIPKDAKGSVLFKSVIKSLELNNEQYFGLQWPDKENFNMWLEMDKKIKSQVKSDVYQFQFRVKYYVPEPALMLEEELTRMNEKTAILDDIKQENHVHGVISKQINYIDEKLMPIKQLKKLSKSGQLDQEMFVDQLFMDQLAQIALELVKGLHHCRATLIDVRTVLEKRDDILIPRSDNTPLLETQISNLKTQIDKFATTPPPAPVLDYSKIKFPALQLPTLPKVVQPPSTTTSPVKASHDTLMRKCNVIVRGLPCPQSSDPTSVVRSFLKDCNVDNFVHHEKNLVTAQILNRYNDVCSIRAVFNNHWTVESILNCAHKLKGVPQYQRVYLDKDRTPEEMVQHKKLLAELKKKIAEDDKKRWIIADGNVIEKGQFIKLNR